jgi:hypothetical protein
MENPNKISEHFIVQEFINPETYKKDGDQSIKLIDSRLIEIAEFLRMDLGIPITINNWHVGGRFHESGLRDPNTTTGAKLSAHKIGKAIDVKAKGFDGQRWYEYVKKNYKKLYDLGLRRIEDRSIATTWCHMDTKEHGKKCIQVIDRTDVIEEIKIA